LLLNKIQKIKATKIKNFYKYNYNIPLYTNKILLNEADLFFKWYSPKIFKDRRLKISNKKIKNIINLLVKKIKEPNNTLVHRDFHVSNLIINSKKQIGLIDNQDALIGNIAYDLASLIDDVRYRTSNSLKDKVYNYYLKTNKNIHKKKFKNDFDIL